MKKLILSAGVILMLSVSAVAQGNKNSRAAAPKAKAVRLQSTSANEAKAPVAERSFSIADPVVNFYNGRVAGTIRDNDVDRPVIGMPRLRNGVAHGHLLFYNTTSPNMGGNTGSGSVGTGSSTGSIGTSGAASGVNGKNPFSGPGMYGNRVQGTGRPVTLPPSDVRHRDANDQKP